MSAFEMNPVVFEGPKPVDGYGPAGFRIGGEWFDGAVLVTAAGARRVDPSAPMMGLADAPPEGIDLLLMGMGAEVAHPDPALRAWLEARGIAPEPMASPAAARTFNVLVAEGRSVGALLLPTGSSPG